MPAATGSSPDTGEWLGIADEPFDTLRRRVVTLCQQLWPDVPSGRFLVEDVGESVNDRIIGIKWLEASAEEGESDENDSNPPRRLQGDYICRIARECRSAAPGSWMAALGRFLQRRLTFPVPTVVHFDNSGDSNPLGRPYVVQHRLAGRPLDVVYPSLNHNQKMMVALDMARLTRELMAISNPTHGTPLEEDLASSRRGEAMRTAGYGVFSEKQVQDPTSLVQARAPAEILLEKIDKRLSEDEDREDWVRAENMVRQIHEQDDIFAPGPDGEFYYLDHGGLWTHNLLVRTPTSDSAVITGVIGWDEARFAPAAVAFIPPAWLWHRLAFNDGGDIRPRFWGRQDLLRMAHQVAAGPRNREIRRLFHTAVGADFIRHAHSRSTSAARSAWDLIVHGPDVSEEWREDISDMRRAYMDRAKNMRLSQPDQLTLNELWRMRPMAEFYETKGGAWIRSLDESEDAPVGSTISRQEE